MKKIKFKRITKIISVALLLLFVCISNAFITKGASPGTTEVGENEVSFDGEESLGYSYSLHVWLSKEKMGEACGTVYPGDFVYLCYELTEQSTGKPYSTFDTAPISAHEVFKKNDGSVIYEYTYDNDNNWIGIEVPKIESFTGTVEITGAITLEATVGCNVVIPDDTHMFCASAGGSEIKKAVLNSTCYYRYRLYDKNTNKNLFEVADKNDFKLTVDIKDPDGYRVLYDTPSVDEKNYSFKAGKVGKYTCVVTLSGRFTGSITHELEIYKIDVTGVRLSSDKLEMIEGNTAVLKETVLPENASNKNVSWESTNTSVAKVDNKGNVTAVKPGTATINVYTVDGGYKASCKVTVLSKTVPVTGVNLNISEKSLYVGDSFYITATVKPDNATNKKITWSSGNSGIASVDQYGKVTAHSEGKTTITVITEDGKYIASCKVTVLSKTVPVTGVNLNISEKSLYVGDSFYITATVKPDNATNKKITWSSGNSGIASVDQYGKVTAHSEGKATITAITEDGKYIASCKVTVLSKTVPVSGVNLNISEKSLYVGDSFYITATVKPDNATNKNITWSSDASGIASVDQYGKVTANSEGKATITVITEDGNFKAECRVSVTKKTIKVKKVTLNKSELNLNVGESEKLKAILEPADTDEKKVIWSSNNTNVAVVDNNGKITAKAPGTVAIRVTTENGKSSARCIVNVKNKNAPAVPDEPVKPSKPEKIERVNMFRVYNSVSGEHFYTSSQNEISTLVYAGWKNEGIAWKAPKKSKTPVYRLYNPNEGDHHYTTSRSEKERLVSAGWKYEGIGWYSDDAKGVALYRLYNPNARAGSHHYTTNVSERNNLVKAGWKYEGIAWYGVK